MYSSMVPGNIKINYYFSESQISQKVKYYSSRKHIGEIPEKTEISLDSASESQISPFGVNL